MTNSHEAIVRVKGQEPWRPGQLRYLLIALMGAAMVTAGCVQLYQGVIRPYQDVGRARTWKPAPIRAWEMEVHPFHGVMHADFSYTYEYEGRRYRGRRYAFKHPTRFLDEDRLLALQHAGPAECFVNGQDPAQAVVVRDLPRSAYHFSEAACAVPGMLMTWWALLLYGRPRRPRAPERLRTLGYRAVAGLLGLWGLFLAGSALTQTPARVGGMVLGTLTVGVAAGLARRHPAAVALVIGTSVLGALFIPLALINPFAYADVASDTIHEPGLWVDYGATVFGLVALFASPGAIAAAAFGQIWRSGPGGASIPPSP